jgi:peptidoglycan-associated lipoprotein
MKQKSMLFLVLVMAVSLVGLWGCPKKADVSAVPEQQAAAPAETPAADAGAQAGQTDTAATEAGPQEAAAAAGSGLQPIYFDFDRSLIRDDAKEALRANADWLKANPQVNIRIEGNCDERGTVEYNQALGQRRAQSAKKYLTGLGIASRRISLISYGKEKPTCASSTEDCWQQNRRDDFVAQE